MQFTVQIHAGFYAFFVLRMMFVDNTASKERTVKTFKYRLTDWNGAAAPEKKRKSYFLNVYCNIYCTFKILSYETVIAWQYFAMFYAYLHHLLKFSPLTSTLQVLS